MIVAWLACELILIPSSGQDFQQFFLLNFYSTVPRVQKFHNRSEIGNSTQIAQFRLWAE